MYKNQLQELAQHLQVELPTYTCLQEGPHDGYRVAVNFNGEVYESERSFSKMIQAEQSAAKVACHELQGRYADRMTDVTVYKNLLQEATQKADVPMPSYTCTVSHVKSASIHKCTVEVAGMSFLGGDAKTKKEAEKLAALNAWNQLKQRFVGRENNVTEDEEKAIIAEAFKFRCRKAQLKVTNPNSPAHELHSAHQQLQSSSISQGRDNVQVQQFLPHVETSPMLLHASSSQLPRDAPVPSNVMSMQPDYVARSSQQQMLPYVAMSPGLLHGSNLQWTWYPPTSSMWSYPSARYAPFPSMHGYYMSMRPREQTQLHHVPSIWYQEQDPPISSTHEEQMQPYHVESSRLLPESSSLPMGIQENAPIISTLPHHTAGSSPKSALVSFMQSSHNAGNALGLRRTSYSDSASTLGRSLQTIVPNSLQTVDPNSTLQTVDPNSTLQMVNPNSTSLGCSSARSIIRVTPEQIEDDSKDKTKNEQIIEKEMEKHLLPEWLLKAVNSLADDL